MRAAPSFHSRSRPDDFEQLVGARCRGRPRPFSPRPARTVPHGRRHRRRAAFRAEQYPPLAPKRLPAPLWRGRFPACSRGLRTGHPAVCLASSFSPAAISARARPPMTSALSGAISWTCRKIDTARSLSPSASTASPIAISGSISACGVAPSGSIFSCASSWSRTFLSWRFAAVIGEVGDGLAAIDRVDGRDRLDAELRSEQLVLVDVDPGELHAFAGIIRGELLEHRRQLLAQRRAVGPEIEDDQAPSSTAE